MSKETYEDLGQVSYQKTEGFEVVAEGGKLYYHITNPQLIDALAHQGVYSVAPGHTLLEVNAGNSIALGQMGVNMQGYESVRYTEEWPLYNQQFTIGDHQIATGSFIINNMRCIVANEQRTGKTFSFIAACMLLARMNMRKAVVIVAPLTLLELVWEREILLSDPSATVRVIREQPPVYVEVMKAGRKRPKRKKVQERMDALEVLQQCHKEMMEAYSIIPHDQASFEVKRSRLTPYYIIDPDAARHNPEIKALLQEMVRSGMIDMFGIDESTFFANSEAQRTMAISEVINAGQYETTRVVMMTGTPGNPKKMYAQSKLCDPRKCWVSEERWMQLTTVKGDHVVPGNTKTPRREYAKPNWIQYVLDLTPAMIRYETNDVIDVVVHAPETLRTTLSEEQRVHYEAAVRESLLVFQNNQGELTAKEIEHSMTMITKARQISLGTFLTDEGEVVELDYTERLNDIVTIIKEAKARAKDKKNGGKTIVFTSYTAPTWRLSRDLTKLGIKNVVITGEVTDTAGDKARMSAAQAFMEDPSVQVMLAHPQTVAYGVEASSGNTIIWNGPVAAGAETYSQGCSRCSSIKQNDEVKIYHLVATAYEDAGFVSLSNALDEREVLLDLARNMTRKGVIL